MLMLHDFPIVLDVIVDIVFIVEGYFHECFLLLRQAFVLFDLQITIVLVQVENLSGATGPSGPSTSGRPPPELPVSILLAFCAKADPKEPAASNCQWCFLGSTVSSVINGLSYSCQRILIVSLKMLSSIIPAIRMLSKVLGD